ncbi:MAG: hypothetical protein A2Y33_07855 [Spirochaetes bacterium GWF1_51_8]|nr:MAG: hypothetical protein A2Y33_07855 [Spirochaetes bacterium GWF1_51_8]
MRSRLLLLTVFTLFTSRSVWGITVYLPKTVYTASPYISLAALCQTSIGSNYIIPLTNSKVFSNKELGQYFVQAGYDDFTLIGGGVEVKYFPYLSTAKDIADGLLAYYPNALPSIKPESLPGKYFIQSSDYSLSGGKVLASLQCIDFSSGIGVPKTLLLTFGMKNPSPAVQPMPLVNTGLNLQPALPVPANAVVEDEVYIVKIEDYKAFLAYKMGGLTIIVEARIIRKLDETSYLVENVNSGKMLIVKMLTK